MTAAERQSLINALTDKLSACRKNALLSESELIKFCKARDIPVFGVHTGDPSKLHNCGLLREDGRNNDDSQLYHPFRFYVVHEVLDSLRIPLARSAYLERDKVLPSLDRHLREWLPTDTQISQRAAKANTIVDLAILLEPVYWRYVTGIVPGSVLTLQRIPGTSEYTNILKRYIQTLPPEEWKPNHDRLRISAANTDDNGSLYLLLRLSSWEQRQKLTGKVSLALWIRHMAELIRLAFEEVHGVQWDEEDWAYGTWLENGRKFTYGFERPLDKPDEAQSRLAFLFRLATGSSVRWYVEGETEFNAICEFLPNPARVGIELVNLRGNIATGRDNIAMKLSDALEQDMAHRRFSIISIDADVATNVKFIQKQVSQERIVGYIAVHNPDFEFANFTVSELVEIVSHIDEKYGFGKDPLSDWDWTEVVSSKEFERIYCQISHRDPRCLKGSEWGRALAAYAKKHPLRPDTKCERPIVAQFRLALMGRTAHYDYQKENLCFDDSTFQLIKRSDKQPLRSHGE